MPVAFHFHGFYTRGVFAEPRNRDETIAVIVLAQDAPAPPDGIVAAKFRELRAAFE